MTNTPFSVPLEASLDPVHGQEGADPLPTKISVATVTYNAASLIERTIESVAQQTYTQVEHIIIDGNSTDNTLAIIHEYQKTNSRAIVPHEVVCLSEPDEGLYDAMNKALDLSTGHYIVFLNAGDTFPDRETLTRVAALGNDRPAVIYGQTKLVDFAGNVIGDRHLSAPEHLTWGSFRQGMLVCHQAFYARADLARRTPYDLSYRFSADYDWTVRLLALARKRHLKTANTHSVLCHYLHEGLTTANHKASLWERFRIMCRHYGVVSTLLHHIWFIIRR